VSSLRISIHGAARGQHRPYRSLIAYRQSCQSRELYLSGFCAQVGGRPQASA
jgi:hypothetical protein